MKRGLLLGLGLLGVFTLTVAWWAATSLLSPWILQQINIQGSKAIAGQVQAEGAEVTFFPPGAKILSLTAKKPGVLTATVPEMQIIAASFFDFTNLKVKIKNPNITLVLPPTPQNAPTAQPAKAAARIEVPSDLPPFKLLAEINGGTIQVQRTQPAFLAKFQDLTVTIDAPGWAKNWSIESAGKVVIEQPVRLDLPYRLKAGALLKVPELHMQILPSTLDVGGLNLALTGSSQINEQTHLVNLKADVPDIAKLRLDPSLFPVQSPRGSVKAVIHAQSNKGGPWTAAGSLSVANFYGNLNIRKEDMNAIGPLTMTLDTEFAYQDGFSIRRILSSINASEAIITYGDLFIKPRGTPLTLDTISSFAGDQLQLDSFIAKLAWLQLEANGTIASVKGRPSRINAVLHKSNLKGLEQLFPFIKGYPLTGTAELNASVNGDLQNPPSLSLNINPIKLEGVQANLTFKSKDGLTYLNGPAKLNAKAIVIAKGEKLVSSNLTAEANLSGMTIQYADMFLKNPGQVLQLTLAAALKGDRINISRGALDTPAGRTEISGFLKRPQAPVFDLIFKIPRLDLGTVGRLSPMVGKYGLGGVGQGNVRLAGNWDFKGGIATSPLTLTGSLSAKIPRLSYMPEPAEKVKEMPAPANEPPPTALAPNWPIMRGMNLNLDANISDLLYDRVHFSNMGFRGKIQYGFLTGSGSVAKAFDGSVTLEKLNVPLLTPNAEISFVAKARGVESSKLIDWMFPEYKGLISGEASGQTSVQFPWPKRKDFVARTKAQGALDFQNGFLNTLKFEKMVNEKLRSLPKIGLQQTFSTGGARANMDMTFAFEGGRLNFSRFHVLTPEKNELVTSGWFKTDMSMDITGTAYLSNPPVEGCIRVNNADQQGRLVVPDMGFSGNAFSPQFKIAETTIAKMIGNCANAEIKKKTKEVEQDLKQKAETEAKKLLKGVFGN